MAWQIPLSSTGPDTQVPLGDTDSVVVGKYIQLGTTGTDATIFGEGGGLEARIYGSVFGSGSAISLGTRGFTSGNKVLISSDGHVETLSGFGYAVILYGEANEVRNDGTLIASGFGVVLGGTERPGIQSTLINTGMIETGWYAVSRESASTETIVLENSGTISGKQAAFRPNTLGDSTGIELITNTGKMIGDVVLEGGNDLYDGRLGTIKGDVLGGEGTDRLYAGAGDNRLFGENGDDTLIGGSGADHLSGGADTDRVAYTSATKAVTVSLADPGINTGDAKGDTFDSVENLTGSVFSDFLYGSNSANSLIGAAGNDKIKGYGGNDALTGGSGLDTFVFNSALSASTNVDRIVDFSRADDTIQIDNANFIGLVTGALAAGAFKDIAVSAKDASDRILYNSDSGNLYYDRDGSGTVYDAIKFAVLTGSPTITAADFVVI